MRRLAAAIIVYAAVVAGRFGPIAPAAAPLPSLDNSVKFAVIGDSGTGDRPQYEVGEQMARSRGSFLFDFVIMLGDNMYGRQQPQDFMTKFERPYAPLLAAGVTFQASLGNHDNESNRSYPGFQMHGERYYTFVRGNARFFVLDTNQLDRQQLAWIDNVLKQSGD